MSDDLFGGEYPDEGEEAFEKDREELSAVLSRFAEERDISQEDLSLLLLDAAATTRSLAYFLSVEKPSEGGLRLEYDRFGRAFLDLIREAKKESGAMLAHFREVIAEEDSKGEAGKP